MSSLFLIGLRNMAIFGL